MNKPYDPLFEIKDVSLVFQVGNDTVTAVQKCSVHIPRNAITIIYGPSGSGKSSLLNVLSGLQKPSTGTLCYDGKDVYNRSQNELAHFRAHELGIVYQTNYWVKSLSVLENVSLPQYFLGKTAADAHSMAELALKRVDMAEYLHKSPLMLSGGEQQRIAMARALINDSPVIIADEPTGNLDSKNGEKIVDLLVELREMSGKTIILVTHNMEYLPIADHLIEIQDGHVSEISEADIPATVHRMLKDSEQRITRLVRKDTK